MPGQALPGHASTAAIIATLYILAMPIESEYNPDMKKKEKSVTIIVMVPPKLRTEAQKQAAKRGMSMSALIRMAVRKELGLPT